MDLNEAYERITEVGEFVKNFKDDDDFCDWLRSGTLADLQACLKVFEKAEFYEKCVLIQKVIKEKVEAFGPRPDNQS